MTKPDAERIGAFIVSIGSVTLISFGYLRLGNDSLWCIIYSCSCMLCLHNALSVLLFSRSSDDRSSDDRSSDGEGKWRKYLPQSIRKRVDLVLHAMDPGSDHHAKNILRL